jgi:hypothetical protein
MLASSSLDRTVRLWDTTNGECVRVIEHPSPITCVEFTPSGNGVISGDTLGIISAWDPEIGELAWESKWDNTFAWNTAITCLSVGQNIIAAGRMNGQIGFWETVTGVRLRDTHIKHDGMVQSVHLSRDERVLVSSSEDGTIEFWNVETGESLFHRFGLDDPQGIVLTPDEDTVVCATRKEIVFLNFQNGTIRKTYPANRPISVDVSPDGLLVAFSGYDRKIIIMNLETDDILPCYPRELRDVVKCIRFSADGSVLASGSYDRTVKLWDVNTGQELMTLSGHTQRITGIAFRRDYVILM